MAEPAVDLHCMKIELIFFYMLGPSNGQRFRILLWAHLALTIVTKRLHSQNPLLEYYVGLIRTHPNHLFLCAAQMFGNLSAVYVRKDGDDFV